MSYRDSATINNGSASGVTSATVAVPTDAQAGDVMVVSTITNLGTVTQTISGPSGTWTTLSGPDYNNGNVGTYVWIKEVASGDPGATVTITTSTSCRLAGVLEVLSGDTVTGVLTQLGTDTTQGTTITMPSETTSATPASWDILEFYMIRTIGTTAGTATAPTGYTTDATSTTAFSTSPQYTAQVALNPSGVNSTSYGGETVTCSQTVSANMYVVAVPSAGGTDETVTGSVSPVTVDAPLGSVAADMSLSGLVSPVTVDAPLGAVGAGATLSGLVSPVTVGSPAGSIGVGTSVALAPSPVNVAAIGGTVTTAGNITILGPVTNVGIACILGDVTTGAATYPQAVNGTLSAINGTLDVVK